MEYPNLGGHKPPRTLGTSLKECPSPTLQMPAMGTALHVTRTAAPAPHSAFRVLLNGHRKWRADEYIMIGRDLDMRPTLCSLGEIYSSWASQIWPFCCQEIKTSSSFPSPVHAGEKSESANSQSIRKGLLRPRCCGHRGHTLWQCSP